MAEAKALTTDQAFAASIPWGCCTPTGLSGVTIALCEKLPGSVSASYALNKLLRGPIKNGPKRVFDVHRFDLRMRLVTRGNYCETTALFAPQFYDVPERSWIAAQLTSGSVFLDIGSNAGLYSLSTAKAVPGVRVLAVEPDPSLAARMRFNASTNGLCIEHHALALGDEDGTAHLLLGGDQSGANRIVGEASPQGQHLTVRIVPLISLCKDAGIERIDVMKIDIEGHEKPVLDHFFAHAPSSLWPDGILIEHSHDYAGLVDQLVNQVGYRIDKKTARNVAMRRDRT